MIRATTRATGLLRPLCRSQSTQAPQPQRYTVPELSNLAGLQDSGIPGLLSSEGLKNAYYSRTADYSSRLGASLTKHQVDFTNHLDVLITQHARSATKKDIHDYASLLHNVNFAYSLLGKARGSVTEIPPLQGPDSLLATPDLSAEIENAPTGALLDTINRHFGSLLEFKTLLLNSAAAINGDGFTWLVARANLNSLAENGSPQYDALFVVNTYNAGSPTGKDHAGQVTQYESEDPNKEEYTRPHSSSIATYFKARASMMVGKKYTPVLCLDASPKSYLTDYGIYGKKAYLEQWWRSVDWEAVEKNLPEPSMKF